MPLKNLESNQRSEQIQDIIDKMPNKFGIWTTAIIFALSGALLILGWVVKYPDSVVGTVVINPKYAPVKLVANSAGKITLINFKPRQNVKEGDFIAVIQNPANADDVKTIIKLLSKYQGNDKELIRSYQSFPNKVSLGEVNIKYYNFLNTLQLLYNYSASNVFEQQEKGLKHQLDQFKYLLANNITLKGTRENNMKLQKKLADRDSILYAEKVSPEEDVDHSRITYLSSKESFQSINNEIKNDQQQIDDTENKLQQLYIQKSDKENQMHLDMLAALDDLNDEIKQWEQRYVFKAPMDGKVEFLKFWNNNQFVQSGEDVFTVVPTENKTIGQVELPSSGAGKVKPGQEVVIRLDNYPYEEYGSVTGRVNSISLISNPQKINQNNVDIYLVDVDLPNGLTTNYGTKLKFKYQIKGTAEIINEQRRLIQRFFDNLKYLSDKH